VACQPKLGKRQRQPACAKATAGNLRLNYERRWLANRSSGKSETARLRQGYGGQPSPELRAKVGGAGIRTRVRKYFPAGIYDAYPRLKSRFRREDPAKTAGSQPQIISPLPFGATGSRQPAEMTSVPDPQADRDGRSQGFTLRERAACPQLWLFHLVYEGDGPRHASCETISPSNLSRPLRRSDPPLYAARGQTSNLWCTRICDVF
jgi:hypothetical protein